MQLQDSLQCVGGVLEHSVDLEFGGASGMLISFDTVVLWKCSVTTLSTRMNLPEATRSACIVFG